MDEQTLQQWSALHRRSVLGEPMSEAERVAYEAGCRELDTEEKLDGGRAREQELLARMDAVEARQKRLSEQEAAMEAEIAALKRQLETVTRQQLASGN